MVWSGCKAGFHDCKSLLKGLSLYSDLYSVHDVLVLYILIVILNYFD